MLSLGILFRWLSCCRVWDTAARLFAAKEDPRIEYAVVVGHRGMSLSSLSLIDSGLGLCLLPLVMAWECAPNGSMYDLRREVNCTLHHVQPAAVALSNLRARPKRWGICRVLVMVIRRHPCRPLHPGHPRTWRERLRGLQELSRRLS